MTRTEKDITVLEIMELSIMPGSKAWRWGHKGVLRRARKALEEKNNDKRYASEIDVLRAARKKIEAALNCSTITERYGNESVQRMYYSFGIRDACWAIDEIINNIKD